ncbi:GNAT family N-acetyltransferase [Mesorhizobium sp. VK22B]|uniref:GNAT family N-acetyltransferase n=1 Tax=Mesorhizobium captivum TaxID=3072319 RepID=A0ABU4Z7Y8_9HYPH|nr:MULTISPECIES: GNAT family N-acetyltransferase [unclassified Mesorhizobium]MDX8495315.1 GNAT family N-acetyltransferase [Mesorhizobium sp. VK22B]MDX8508722.1 GNAT family N-acetyltransferase [Mesorhizobium sp. VK22E]
MRDDASVSLVAVTPDDLREVENIFGDLTTYSQRVDGVRRRDGAAYAFATALPPGYKPSDKHAFLVKRGDVPVGLLDVINGYPSLGTVFIGLLAIRESAQGSGIGRALVHEAEQFARYNLKARTIRLAVVETNPVFGFWTKMGYRATGEVKPFEGETISSRAVLMEKKLPK